MFVANLKLDRFHFRLFKFLFLYRQALFGNCSERISINYKLLRCKEERFWSFRDEVQLGKLLEEGCAGIYAWYAEVETLLVFITFVESGKIG